MKSMGMGAAAAVLLCAGAGNADTLEFNIDTVFSSSQAVGYVNVKFEAVGSGDVKLTITSFLSTTPDREYMGALYLNFDDSLDVTKLGFGSEAKAGAFDSPSISLKKDEFKADGDGRYDILLEFGTSASSRFDGADKLEYMISYGLGDILAKDFNHLSKPEGGHGPFLAAAHFQSLAGGKSGWHSPTLVPLPAPAYVGLAGLGLAAGVSVVKRRR